MLILLGTAFLPIVGIEFGWVTVHWVTGLVLIAAVLFHVVRVLVRGTLAARCGSAARTSPTLLDVARATLRAQAADAAGPGKYSVAQKLIHHAFAVVVLTTLVTGGFMLARIDTPWWQRNPYLLADATWGIVYVLHGLGGAAAHHDGDDARLLRAAAREAEVHARDDSRLDHAPRVRRAPRPGTLAGRPMTDERRS